MRKWYVPYLVKASIHFNRLPIELFILFPLSYCSHSSRRQHLCVRPDFCRSRDLSGVHLILGRNGESRHRPGANIAISPFSLCTGADGARDSVAPVHRHTGHGGGIQTAEGHEQHTSAFPLL